MKRFRVCFALMIASAIAAGFIVPPAFASPPPSFTSLPSPDASPDTLEQPAAPSPSRQPAPPAAPSPVPRPAPTSFDGTARLLDIRIKNIGAYGFEAEFTINDAAVRQNALLIYAHTKTKGLLLDEDTVKVTSHYLKSVSKRVDELTLVSSSPDSHVYLAYVPAAFPNTYYLYAMLETAPEKNSGVIVETVFGGGTSGDSIIPNPSPQPTQGAADRPALISAAASNENAYGYRFDLNIVVANASDRPETELVIAYAEEPGLFVHENNITGAFGLSSFSHRLQSLYRTSYSSAESGFFASVNVWRPGYYYVYVMLRIGGSNSRIIELRVNVTQPAAVPTPLPIAPPGDSANLVVADAADASRRIDLPEGSGFANFISLISNGAPASASVAAGSVLVMEGAPGAKVSFRLTDKLFFIPHPLDENDFVPYAGAFAVTAAHACLWVKVESAGGKTVYYKIIIV